MARRTGVEGFEEVRRRLRGLPEKLQRKVLGKATLAAAREIVKEAKVLAPVDTGTLRRNIVAVTSRKNRRSRRYGAQAIVGVRHGRYIKRRGARLRNLDDPYYFRFQELGYYATGRARRRKARNPRFIPGFRFLQRGLRRGQRRAIAKMAEVARRELRKLEQ